MDKQMYLDLEINTEMAEGHIKYLMPYIDAIIRRTLGENNPHPAMEVGIGTGLCSIFLEKNIKMDVVAIDKEREIVDKFKNFTKPYFDSHVKVGVYDTFDLTQAREKLGHIGVIHHQGLLEHFSEEDTVKILDHQLEICEQYVVFAVPIIGHKDSEYDHSEVRKSFDWWVDFLDDNDYLLYEAGMFGMDAESNQAYFVIKKLIKVN